MGIFRQAASIYTGVPIPSGSSSSSSDSNQSASSTSADSSEEDPSVDEYGNYGTSTLRKVRRSTRRIGDKSNGR